MALRLHSNSVILALILVSPWVSPGFARADASSTAEASQPKKFSTLTIGSVSSSLHSWNSPDSSTGANLLIAPGYAITPNYKLGFRIDMDQTITPLPEYTLNDGLLSLTHSPVELNPYLKWTPSLRSTLPVSKKSHLRDSLLTSFGVANRISFSLERLANPLINRISGYVDLKATRLFHQYSTSTTNASNNQYSIAAEVYGDYAFTDKFSFGLDVVRAYGLTYETKQRDSFAMDGSFSYQLLPTLALGVGASNAGSTLKANGFDSNMSLFDPYTTSAYGSITYVY